MKLLKSFALPDYLASVVIALYFFFGFFTFGTYGVNWDDGFQRQNGLDNWSFITNTDRAALINNSDKYHGPAFEILLVMVEKVLHLTDAHDIYQWRHYMVSFFFGITLIVFYLLCIRIFRDHWLGLLAICLLLFSPRIFGESLYNPKDITFLCAMIWAMYSLSLFTDTLSVRHSLFHSFCCAFAIDIRVIGILFIPITFAILAYHIYQKKYQTKQVLTVSIFFTFILFAFMVWMWPILRLDIFEQLWLSYRQLSNYTLFENGLNIYIGDHIRAGSTPWHYHWLWLMMTLPEIYLVTFAAGFIMLLRQLLKRKPVSSANTVLLITSVFLFFAPLLLRSFTLSIVLDGWRHMYFVYPFFVIVAVFAVSQVQASGSKNLKYAIWGLLGLGIADSLVNIIAMHPYQYCYFNHTANSIFDPIDKKFEMDYWGVSYKQGLEYLAAHTPENAGKIKVAFANDPGVFNYEFLNAKLRDRFQPSNGSDAQYYLTNYRTNIIPGKDKEYHTITVQGNAIMGIYKLQ